MMAEVDVHRDACESEVSKLEDVNVNVNVNVNVGVGVIDNGNGASKDHGDGSYVFVSSGDGGTSDESDLANGHCSGVETNGGQSELKLKGEVEESVVVVENPQSQLQEKEKAAAAAGSVHSGDPEIALEIQSEEDQPLVKDLPVEDLVQESELTSQSDSDSDSKLVKDLPVEDLVQESELTSQSDSDSKLDKQGISDPETKENLDSVLACDNGSSENGGSVAADSVEVEVHLEREVANGTVSDENRDVALPTHDVQESLSDSTTTNQLVDIAEENNGSCEENGQDVDVQESISEPTVAEEVNTSCKESGQTLADNVDVRECVSEPIEKIDSSCEENGQILAANDDVQESVSETNTEKINGLCEENGQILTVNVDVQESVSEHNAEKVNGLCEENGQFSAATLDVQESNSEPITESNGSCEENGHILAANVNILESAGEHIAEQTNGLCDDNGQIFEHDVEVQKRLETQVVNDHVSESGDDLLGVHAHEESISEPVDANLLADKPEENRSCGNGEPLAAVEVQNQLKTPVVSGPISDESGDLSIVPENISEPIITDSLVDTPETSEDNGSSEKASVCENVPVENGESFTTVADSDTKVSGENRDSPYKEENSTHSIDHGTVTDVEKIDEKNDEKPSSCPREPSEPDIEAESVPIQADTSSFTANGAISEPYSKSDIEPEIASVTDDSPSFGNDAESEPSSKPELEAESVSGPPASDSMSEPNLKSEVESGHALIVDDELSKAGTESKIPPVVDDTLSSISADDAIQELKSSHDSIGGEEPESNDAVRVADAGLSNLEAECTDNDGKPALQINDSTKKEAIVRGPDEPSVITDDRPESGVPTIDSHEGHDKVVEVEKRPFYYLIRCPRNDDENLKEQIKLAQLQVEEKTKNRDVIRSKMQMQWATCKEHKLKFEAAISEERAAQELLKAKRREMDSVQFMNNKVKDALSVEEIANTIRYMEHTMSHETLPLKEEKQYIRDIKQLKQRRDQLSSSLGKQDEVQQSLDQKDHIERRIQDLKEEMDQLRGNLLEAQNVTQAAKKKYNVENGMLHELQYQFEAADATRQEAYVHLQSLRKQNYEKTKHFWRYRNDAKAANDLALSGEKEKLQRLCINQVETFHELWQTNKDFREEYTKCNTRSTLRRLRTFDGRALGPDEDPPAIPDIVRVTRHNMAAAVVSTPEPAKQVAIVEFEEPNGKSAVEIVEQHTETAKNKKPVKVASAGISHATVSGRNEIEEELVDDPKPTKEEEELARKEEELRKEQEVAKLREQRRVEEKAKAKEAMERKKKIAEKAQARAAIKAQKKAEEKEKEREKQLRKKERKKASATKATNGINEGESSPEPSSEITTETPVEAEATEKPVAVTKRSQKAPQFTKQTKVKPIPLPPRNRSKRRMQPWMWVLVTVVAVLGLFLLGNGGSFSFKSMLERFY